VRKNNYGKTEELDEDNNEKSQNKSVIKKGTKNSHFSISKNEKSEKCIYNNENSIRKERKNEELDMEEIENLHDIDKMQMDEIENNQENEKKRMENIKEMDEEKNEENENNDEADSHSEDDIHNKKKSSKSKKSVSKILKTNSSINDGENENYYKRNNNYEHDNENQDNSNLMKDDKINDILMGEIEEIKDYNNNTNFSNVKKTTQTLRTNDSKKKEKEATNYSIKSKPKIYNVTNNQIYNQEEIDKSSTNYFGAGNGSGRVSEIGRGTYLNNNLSKNKMNNTLTTQSYQKESKSRKNETLNLNDDLNKINKNLYESVPDISRNEKSVTLQKLTNIPAACEIEEYDFLFIDLEEFIHFHSNGFPLFELAEFMKKISTENKKPRIVLNYPNILINLNVVNLDILQNLMDIMSYTDIFLFEKKECLAFFNMLSQMNYEKDLNDKQLNDYFFKEIPHYRIGISKLGLFLDDMLKFNIAEQRGEKILNDILYDINLYPKINHFNQKTIEEYKKIIAINNSYFKSIFFGGFFSSYVFNLDFFQSFKSGAESTKRILEIFKNKIDFPTNPEFYAIKLQKKKIERDLQFEKLRKKENSFKLDCINKKNSSIKIYNPLFDNNLNAFFANSNIRKQLKEKGFINTNGFVLYDSNYKSVCGSPPKQKKRLDTSDRERHLLLAIKQNKVFILYIKY
jgi:hypothetical protein